jgi:bifunctional non-homologous end joining protein LigD
VLDGEVVCLDNEGRPQFYSLLYRRGEPYFYAFDVLALDGVDWRPRPLRERKRRLARLLARSRGRVRYLDRIIGKGRALYAGTCARNLEGIVAKLSTAPYDPSAPMTWRKIKNPTYSQAEGRWEVFDRFRHRA